MRLNPFRKLPGVRSSHGLLRYGRQRFVHESLSPCRNHPLQQAKLMETKCFRVAKKAIWIHADFGAILHRDLFLPRPGQRVGALKQMPEQVGQFSKCGYLGCIELSSKVESWHRIAVTPDVEFSVRAEFTATQIAAFRELADLLRH